MEDTLCVLRRSPRPDRQTRRRPRHNRLNPGTVLGCVVARFHRSRRCGRLLQWSRPRFPERRVPHEKPREKLLLFDAMSLVFRAFFAPMQMALVSPQGLPTKAIYIFVRTLRKLLKDYAPEHVAVAFDLSAPTFRDKLFADYKADRPQFPEDLTVQLPYV